MAVVGSAQVLIRPTFSGMQREISRELQGVGEDAGRRGGRSMGDSLKKWGKRGALIAGGAIAAGFGASLATGFSRLTAIEDAEAMLRGLGHSAEDVEAIMQNAMDSTEGTAIRMDKMATTAAQMVAAGIEPGKELEEVLRLVGDSATIAGGDMDGMSQIFGKVAAANRVSMQEVNQMHERGIPILQMVADEMGVTQEAARDMVSAGEVDFETFASAMETGLGGAAQEAGGTMRGSLENLGAYVARFGASLLEGVFPSVREGINGISEWLQGLEPVAQRIGEVVGEWVKSAAETVGNFIQEFRDGEGAGGRFREIVETIGDVLRTAFEFVRDTAIPALQRFGGWLVSIRGWLIPIAAGVGAIVAAWKTYQIIMGIVRTVTLAFTAVQTALNVVLAMNPIGIVVLALVGLAAAFAVAWNRSETFRNVVTGAWEGIKSAISAVWDWMKSTFESIKNAFSSVANFFTDDSTAMGKAFTALRDVLKQVWNWIDKNVLEVFRKAITFVRSVFTGDTEKMKTAFRDLFDSLLNYYKSIARLVFTPFEKAWDAVAGFFGRRVDDVKGAWNSLKSAFKAVWDWINDNVFQRFRRGIDNIAGWVSDAVSNIDRAWRNIANKFRDPINWVINTVWNDGIARVFNNVADAIGINTRLSRNASIPRFAEGGRHSGGWALVGEEGPELVNFSDPARIYTAAETAQALAQGRDLSRQQANAAAGNSPAEALAPMGGNWLSRAWGAVTGWVRGGLASAAELILNPITSRIASTMGQWGSTGDLFGDTMLNAKDRLLDWIRGKDDEAPEVGADGWVRPSRGPITSRFGPRWGGHHAGIDVAGGGPTFAAAAGTVLRTGWNILAGRTGIGILLQHAKDLFTYYGHNPPGGVAVRPGDSVTAGQRIGRQGATGNVTGVHVHFELHRGGIGRAVNPEQLGVFDSGGWLMPGQMGANLSRSPEPVLTGAQWRDIHQLATAGGGGGPEYLVVRDVDGGLIGRMQVEARGEVAASMSGTRRSARAQTGSVR